MESIKTCNFRGFIEEIGGDIKNEDRLLFDALVAQYLNMKECFMERQFKNRDARIRTFCLKIIGHDVIATEIVRLISTCNINLKLHDELH